MVLSSKTVQNQCPLTFHRLKIFLILHILFRIGSSKGCIISTGNFKTFHRLKSFLILHILFRIVSSKGCIISTGDFNWAPSSKSVKNHCPLIFHRLKIFFILHILFRNGSSKGCIISTGNFNLAPSSKIVQNHYPLTFQRVESFWFCTFFWKLKVLKVAEYQKVFSIWFHPQKVYKITAS